jgi:hypothetical protein
MLLAQKASQAFIAALLIWLSSKVAATMACRRSALPSGRACRRLNTASQLAGDVAHGRFQQTVLIFEIVTDDPGRYARPSGDLRDGRVVHSHFIYCVQRGVDQLPAPDRLHPQFGHFCHSIHQRWLSIKAVFDWTFNIKCVLIVADLDFNSYKNSEDTG